MLEKFRKNKVIWDKADKRFYDDIRVSESDENGRVLAVKVANGGAVENLTGASLSLYWETKDKEHEGLDAFTVVDIAKGEFELAYTTGMLSNAGRLNAHLVLIDSTGKIVSERFEINVFSGIDENAVESSNSFTALANALITVSQYDGRIANVENNKVDKTTYEQNKVSVNQQLAHTDAEARRKRELEDLSPNVISAIEGGSGTTFNILSIPQEKSVSYSKTNFIKTKKNKFDETKLVEGGHYGTDGVYYEMAGYHYQDDLIPVVAGQGYSFSKSLDDVQKTRVRQTINFITAYNAQGEAIQDKGGRNVNTYTVPELITHIRISSTSSHFNSDFQVELGTEITPYEPFELVIDNLDTSLTNERITERINVENINLPERTLPKLLAFERGSVAYDPNDNRILLPNSSSQMRSGVMFAKAGTTINKVGELNTYFNINLIDIIGGVEYRTGGSNNHTSKYTFQNDTYFRVGQAYADVSVITVSEIDLFDNELFLSSSESYAVALKSEVSALAEQGEGSKKIILPPSIPCVAGKEVHIYLDNVLQYGNYYTAERFEVHGKGNVVEGGFEYKPTTSNSSETIKLDYYKGENIIVTGNTVLKPVDPSTGTGQTKKVIIIGESTTDNNDFRGELVQLFSADALNVEFLGTRGTAPALNEARAGWKTDNFLNNESYGTPADDNAFFNPTTSGFDFSYYMSEQGYTDVDYVFINLGINDISEGNTPEKYITNIQAMIDSVRSYDSSIKIGIGLTNLPTKFENRALRYLKDRLLSLIAALIEEYGNRENEGYFLVPIYTNLDPYWDFPYEERAISKRNPKTTYVGTNTVHPSTIGYYKSADVHYNVIKYMTSQA